MKKMIFALFLIIALAACGSNETGLKQVDNETVQKLVEGEENGFFLAVSNKDEDFIPYLEDALEEKKVKVNYYVTFQPDGEEGEIVDTPVYDFDDLDKKNHLYYIEDGKVSDPLRLTSYDEGTELSLRIQEFIEVHQK